MSDAPLSVRYKNWKGVTRIRQIIPLRFGFFSTAWHPEPQWLIGAVDCEDGVEKDFALKDCDFLTATELDKLEALHQQQVTGECEHGVPYRYACEICDRYHPPTTSGPHEPISI